LYDIHLILSLKDDEKKRMGTDGKHRSYIEDENCQQRILRRILFCDPDGSDHGCNLGFALAPCDIRERPRSAGVTYLDILRFPGLSDAPAILMVRLMALIFHSFLCLGTRRYSGWAVCSYCRSNIK
jgi:hypothetical protein